MNSDHMQMKRTDLLALWGGLLFSLAFTGLIWWAGRRLAAVPLLPDAGASWYYWKLPSPTIWTRTTAWGLYALHQVAIWRLIYRAQTERPAYLSGLHRFNWQALATNALFIGLHFVQTHIWYDGLAQDVSIWSSQGSVVLLLVLVLMMENPRRGLFFGRPVALSAEVVRFIRTYHGYLFAWAIIYTFWYHPMVSTPGHLIGFFYLFLLLLQGSLFYTRLHVNRWWTLVQEVMVLLHGTLVAIGQGADLWPMFAFGFGGIFVITQMHGLGWSRWVRGVVLALYVVAMALVYAARGWGRLEEVVRIPLIDYLLIFILSALIGLGLRVARWRVR